MKINFFTLVWGNDYVRYFLNYSLKAFLNAADSFDSALRLKYYICTKADYVAAIKKHKNYTLLNNIMDIEFVFVSDICDVGDVKYGIMSEASKWIIKKSKNTVLFFLPPDNVWSKESFVIAIDVIRNNNKRVVMAPSLRVEAALVSDQLHDSSYLSLSKIAVNCLHKSIEHFFIDNRLSTDWPSFVAISSGDNMSVFYFHLHPLAIYNPIEPTGDGALILDGEYLESFAGESDIFIPENSENIFGIELTDYEFSSAGFFKNYQSREHFVAFWAIFNCTKLHFSFMRQIVCIGDKDDSAYSTLSTFRNKVIELISSAKDPLKWVASIMCDFVSSLSRYRNIGIYGAGGQGRIVKQMLSYTNIEAKVFFLDDNKNGVFEGSQVLRPEDSLDTVDVVVIASVHFENIRAKLDTLHYSSYFIFPPFFALIAEDRLLKMFYDTYSSNTSRARSLLFWQELSRIGPSFAWNTAWDTEYQINKEGFWI